MPTAPDDVDRKADEFFEQSRELLADRFAEARHDPDRGLRVTIIDLSDDDVAAISDLGRRLGIGGWIRIERADPAALDAWEQLRHDLRRLEDAQPRVLVGRPGLGPRYHRPPVCIELTAKAEHAAADLYQRYGAFVSLRVGALPYPLPDGPGNPPWQSRQGREPDVASTTEMHFVLDGALSVRTGETTTHALILTNLSSADISVHTNGHLTASIVDEIGSVVGGSYGPQISPLIIFTAKPSESIRIPVLVGTDSYSPELGYTIPPGIWHLTALMILSDGRQLLTPGLELTITD